MVVVFSSTICATVGERALDPELEPARLLRPDVRPCSVKTTPLRGRCEALEVGWTSKDGFVYGIDRIELFGEVFGGVITISIGAS
jgi:hypothetical protein